MTVPDDIATVRGLAMNEKTRNAFDRIEAENTRLLEDNVRLSAGVMRLLREREAAVTGPHEDDWLLVGEGIRRNPYNPAIAKCVDAYERLRAVHCPRKATR